METTIVIPDKKTENIIELSIIQRIHEIRGVRVILDFDLARLYEVETKNLNLSVKRNLRRFPPDFMFQLTLDTNIVVMRAFVMLRQYVLNYAELNQKIEKLTPCYPPQPFPTATNKTLC